MFGRQWLNERSFSSLAEFKRQCYGPFPRDNNDRVPPGEGHTFPEFVHFASVLVPDDFACRMVRGVSDNVSPPLVFLGLCLPAGIVLIKRWNYLAVLLA